MIWTSTALLNRTGSKKCSNRPRPELACIVKSGAPGKTSVRHARQAIPQDTAMADATTTAAADPWFQTLFAERMGGANYGKGTEIYKFEKIKRAKRAALAAHPERKLLDFGIGENDDMALPAVREVLKREVDKLDNRGYADNGIQAFKDAVAQF